MIRNVTAKALIVGISFQLLLPACSFAEKATRSDTVSRQTVLAQSKVKYLSASTIRSIFPRSRDVNPDEQVAIDKFNKGDWSGAIIALNTLLAKNPSNSNALARRAICRLNLNKPPVDDLNYAVADVNEAVDQDPANTLALLMRAQIRLAIGNTDGAIQDCHTLLKKEQNALAYEIIGEAAQSNGDSVNAVINANRALAIAPDMLEAWELKGNCAIGMGDATSALDYFNKVISANSNGADGYTGRARAYLFLDRYNDALTDLNQALNLDANCADAYQLRAFANMALGNQPDFLKDAQHFASLSPGDPASHRVLGYAYENNNDIASAAVQYKQAAQLYEPVDDDNKLEMLYSARRAQNNTVAHN